jgi:hypothetical protein
MKKNIGDATQQYGILLNSPKMKKANGLLTEKGRPDIIYKTSILDEAEREARVYLVLMRDMDANTLGMSASVVPFKKGNRFGPAIKKYQLDTGRVVEA